MGAQTDKEFLIRVKADISQAVKELKGFAGEVNKSGKAAKTSDRYLRSMAGNMTLLRNATAGYLSLRGAWSLVQQADAFNVLQVRIKTATKATGDYVGVSKKLYAISQDAGTALATSVGLFQSLARSASELGATTDEMLRLTQAVEQLGIISGASQAAQQAGLLQFSQGLAAVVFRAEEFNSLLENIPEVAQRIAKGMGVTVGQLRGAVLEGEVLSKDVFAALLSQTADISAEFAQIPDSIQRSGVSMSNSFSRFLSQLDQAAKGTGTIASMMRFVSTTLDTISTRISETDLDVAIRKRKEKMVAYQVLLAAGFKKDSDAVQRLVKDMQDLDLEVIALSKKQLASGGKGSGGDTQKPPPKKKPESPEDKQQRQRIERQIAALQLQADTFGATSREVALYKLALQGASDQQLALADAALGSIDADQAFADQVAASEQAVRDENAAYQDWLATLKDEGAQIYAQTRTEQEQLAAEMARLDVLLEAGVISWDTYTRAMFNAEGKFDDLGKKGSDTMDALIAATKGWGDQFTNTLADMVTTGKGNFSDLADAIIRDLARIAIYQSITAPLLGAMGVPGFATGGMVTGPGTGTSDSIPARLSDGEFVQPARAVDYYGANFMESIRRLQLPKFSRGGMVSAVRRPVAKFADGGLVHGGTAAGGESIKVEIDNRGQPMQVDQASAQVTPEGIVISVITDDARRGGPISTTFARTFNLQRGGG